MVLPLVQFIPELSLNLDPESGILGAGGGDLIILSGDETNGQIQIDSQNVSSTTSTNKILTICELVPSGDEPQVTAEASSTGATQIYTKLYDGKNASNTNILTTRYISGNKIAISQTTDSTTGQDVSLTFNHATTTRTDSTDETVQNAGTANAIIRKKDINSTDTIQNDAYELFVFSDPSKALLTDTYGHVIGLKGKTITFKHNKLNNNATMAYSTPSTNVGRVGFTLTDSLSNNAVGTINFASSTLTVAGDATNNQINVNLKWGTFGSTT